MILQVRGGIDREPPNAPVREGLKDVLLGPAQLYEALRDKAGEHEHGSAARPIGSANIHLHRVKTPFLVLNHNVGWPL